MTVADTRSRPWSLVTPAFALVTASALSYFIAIGALLPVIPQYVTDKLGGSSVAVGISVGVFAFSAAALRPFVGRIGDTRGRRVLVVVGASAVAASVFAYGLVEHLGWLLLMRLVSGAGEAAVFVGAATAAQDLAPPDRRGEAASYFSVAIYGGIALGPVIGERLRADHGFDSVWLVAGACCALAAVLGLLMPRDRPEAAVVDASVEPAPRPGGLARFLHPAAVAPGIVLLLGLIGLAGFAAFTPLYVKDLGLDKADGVLAVYALIILSLRILAGRVPDRFGPARTATTSLTVAAAGLFLMAAWGTVTGLYVATVVLALGMAFLYPALFPLVVDRAPETERTHAIGTFSLFFDLSQGLGAPLLGVVVALGNERAAFAASALMSLTALAVFRLSSVVSPTREHADAGPCAEPPPLGS